MRRRFLTFAFGAIIFSSVLTTVPAASAMTPGCQESGIGCSVGSVGPGGGIVFFDAGSPQWWGQFLEAKTSAVAVTVPWGDLTSIYTDTTGGLSLAQQRIRAKRLGMGKSNTLLMATKFAPEGWYLPSKDELDALYNSWKINGLKGTWPAAPMWTSSEASDRFAWYQLFQDGTQFTDANGIMRGLASNKDYLSSPVHVGSNFPATNFQAIPIRAFPPTTGVPPTPRAIPFAPTINAACSAGGATPVCNVGDVGPGGGIVFYDAGSNQSWGRYLEVAPAACEGVGLPWRVGIKRVYPDGRTAAKSRLIAKQVGMGKINTALIAAKFKSAPNAAKFANDLVCGGRDDWFLPSKDELDLVFNNIAQNRVANSNTPLGSFNKGFYWTSTDYNNHTAWTQYFMDGQQFDRVQTMSGNRNPPNPFRVRAVRAFGS